MLCPGGGDTQRREHGAQVEAQVEAQVDTQVHMKKVSTERPPELMLTAFLSHARCKIWGESGALARITGKIHPMEEFIWMEVVGGDCSHACGEGKRGHHAAKQARTALMAPQGYGTMGRKRSSPWG